MTGDCELRNYLLEASVDVLEGQKSFCQPEREVCMDFTGIIARLTRKGLYLLSSPILYVSTQSFHLAGSPVS